MEVDIFKVNLEGNLAETDEEWEDWDDDEDEYEFDPERETTIRAKWAMDGATTLAEAAMMLRVYAEELLIMESEGWTLDQPIEDDYGFLSREF